VQLRGEVICQALVRSGRDLDVVLSGGQIADDGARGNVRQRSTDDPHKYGLGLEVVDEKDGLSRVPVDELDTEDFGLGEGGADLNVELWLGWSAAKLSIDNFLNLDVLSV
jgi:hypothetical protein